MADVNDMFDDITKEQSYYKPGVKKEITPFAKGEYLCHITKVESRIVDVKGGQYKARLYTFTTTVAPENKNLDFHYIGIDGKPVATKGDAYVGKNFRGKLWRFLEPSEKDTFESNSTGNTSYLRFCETIGIECPTVEREIDGKKEQVKALPNLTEEDFLGKPVTAFVDLGRPFKNKDGVEKQYWDCKFCKKWEGGTKLDIAGGNKNDQIPF